MKRWEALAWGIYALLALSVAAHVYEIIVFVKYVYK